MAASCVASVPPRCAFEQLDFGGCSACDVTCQGQLVRHSCEGPVPRTASAPGERHVEFVASCRNLRLSLPGSAATRPKGWSRARGQMELLRRAVATRLVWAVLRTPRPRVLQGRDGSIQLGPVKRRGMDVGQLSLIEPFSFVLVALPGQPCDPVACLRVRARLQREALASRWPWRLAAVPAALLRRLHTCLRGARILLAGVCSRSCTGHGVLECAWPGAAEVCG